MIFVDTGAFIARYIAKDEHHQAAKSYWSVVEKSKERLFTTNFVLDETITLLGRRANYAFAAERARVIFSSGILTILRPGKYDEIEAIKLFEKYSDQEVSYTDCISFVLIRAHKIERVFTFDKHFMMAGFLVVP